MTGKETLLVLAKAKLNITWSDEGTDSRVDMILDDALPVVAEMVGMTYSDDEAMDESGGVFDFSKPSPERVILLNYIAYEWNHQADIFRSAYWVEIAACRQRHELASAVDDSEDTDDGEDGE